MQTVLSSGRTPSRTIWKLAIPAILEQLLLSMVSYVDSAMVGSLGARATAAVAVNTSTIWLVGGVLTAVGVGFTFLVARAIGQGDADACENASRRALVSAIVVGLALGGAMYLLAPHLARWLGAEEAVWQDAGAYMRIVALALVFQSMNTVFSAIIRGAGDMKAPLIVNLSANLLNVVGNFLLIYPARTLSVFGREFAMWGAGMGVAGAAAATAFSQTLGGLSLLVYLFTTKRPIRIQLRHKPKPDPFLMRECVRVALPTALERVCMSFGQIAMTAIVSSLGTAQLAAHHLAITAESVSYLPGYGLAAAATTLVGQALGAKRADAARTFASLTWKLGALLMTAGGALLFFCADPLIRIFSTDPDVIAEGRQILRLIAFVEPFFGVSIVITGSLRGAGDTRASFLISALSMWCVRLPLAYVLAIPCGMSLLGAWLAMAIELVVRALLYLARLKRGKWVYAR